MNPDPREEARVQAVQSGRLSWKDAYRMRAAEQKADHQSNIINAILIFVVTILLIVWPLRMTGIFESESLSEALGRTIDTVVYVVRGITVDRMRE